MLKRILREKEKQNKKWYIALNENKECSNGTLRFGINSAKDNKNNDTNDITKSMYWIIPETDLEKLLPNNQNAYRIDLLAESKIIVISDSIHKKHYINTFYFSEESEKEENIITFEQILAKRKETEEKEEAKRAKAKKEEENELKKKARKTNTLDFDATMDELNVSTKKKRKKKDQAVDNVVIPNPSVVRVLEANGEEQHDYHLDRLNEICTRLEDNDRKRSEQLKDIQNTVTRSIEQLVRAQEKTSDQIVELAKHMNNHPDIDEIVAQSKALNELLRMLNNYCDTCKPLFTSIDQQQHHLVKHVTEVRDRLTDMPIRDLVDELKQTITKMNVVLDDKISGLKSKVTNAIDVPNVKPVREKDLEDLDKVPLTSADEEFVNALYTTDTFTDLLGKPKKVRRDASDEDLILDAIPDEKKDEDDIAEDPIEDMQTFALRGLMPALDEFCDLAYDKKDTTEVEKVIRQYLTLIPRSILFDMVTENPLLRKMIRCHKPIKKLFKEEKKIKIPFYIQIADQMENNGSSPR